MVKHAKRNRRKRPQKSRRRSRTKRTWSQNIVGAQIRRLRYGRGLSQEQFAARCQRLGLDISRATLSKVEAKVRCVSDSELWILAKALRVKVDDLYR